MTINLATRLIPIPLRQVAHAGATGLMKRARGVCRQVSQIDKKTTTTVLKTSAVATAIGVGCYLLYGWTLPILYTAGAIVGSSIAYKSYTKEKPKEDHHQLIELIITSLNPLLQNTPELDHTPRVAATLQELLVKAPHTYTREDYKQLTEHVLQQGSTLFNIHSLEEADQAPFKTLITALDEDNKLTIRSALNTVIDKLTKLSQTQSSKKDSIHPTLTACTRAMINTKKAILTETLDDDLLNNLKTIVIQVLRDSRLLLPSIVPQDLQALQTLRNCLLPRTISRNLLPQNIDAALTAIMHILPNEDPLKNELITLTSQPHLVMQSLNTVTPPSSLNPLQELASLISSQAHYTKERLLQLVKTIDACYDLSLETLLSDAAGVFPQTVSEELLLNSLKTIFINKIPGPLQPSDSVQGCIDIILSHVD